MATQLKVKEILAMLQGIQDPTISNDDWGLTMMEAHEALVGVNGFSSTLPEYKDAVTIYETQAVERAAFCAELGLSATIERQNNQDHEEVLRGMYVKR